MHLKGTSLPSRNLYKCKQSVYCYLCILFTFVLAKLLLPSLLVYPFFYTALLLSSVYFFIPFFILMLLLYFCLFVDYVDNPIIFVFGAFVYHFNNTISIFVIIFSRLRLGHMFTTHNYLFRRDVTSLCSRCNTIISVNAYSVSPLSLCKDG